MLRLERGMHAVARRGLCSEWRIGTLVEAGTGALEGC